MLNVCQYNVIYIKQEMTHNVFLMPSILNKHTQNSSLYYSTVDTENNYLLDFYPYFPYVMMLIHIFLFSRCDKNLFLL